MSRRKFIPILLLAAVTLSGIQCTYKTGDNNEEGSAVAAEASDSIAYDEELATEVGADDYGMRKYVMALLKAGPNRDQDSTRAVELQRAHLNNINRLAEEGKLVLAGPFMDNGELRGIYVFDVETVEEARELTESDPAIKAGSLEMELHPWYGSAALKKVNEIHSKVSKKNP